jgi:acetyl esterase/lipase
MADDQRPQERIVYKTIGQRQLALDMSYPPDWKRGDKRPAIIFFFGGGWTAGSPGQFRPQAEYLAKRGMVCARADYRLRVKDSVTVDQCVEDAMSAMRWLRGHAAQLGVDPNRIVAAGGSAGGHLAACTFFAEGVGAKDDPAISPKPNALILYNPVLNVSALKETGKFSKLVDGMDEKTMKGISPFFLASKDAPPTLFIDGTEDVFNPEIREFIKKCTDLGAPKVEGYFVEGQPHAFFNRAPWQENTALRADEFLRSIGYLKDEPKAVFQSQPAGEGPGGAVPGKSKNRER